MIYTRKIQIIPITNSLEKTHKSGIIAMLV